MANLAPEFVPYGFRYKYPHMGPRDKAIWEQFIASNPGFFDTVAYDVPVGFGTEMDTVVNPATGGDVNKLYQRKIDVVAFKDDKLFVIEVKPDASTAAIGQVKGYISLYVRDYKPQFPVSGIILTDRLMPEMEYLSATEGVNLIVV